MKVVRRKTDRPVRRNIEMGFIDKAGRFHPIRRSADYDERRLRERGGAAARLIERVAPTDYISYDEFRRAYRHAEGSASAELARRHPGFEARFRNEQRRNPAVRRRAGTPARQRRNPLPRPWGTAQCCHPRCMGAIGPACDCPCHGKNHKAGPCPYAAKAKAAKRKPTRRNMQLALFGGIEAKPNKKRAVRYKGYYIKPHKQGGYEISGLNTIFGMVTFSTLKDAKQYVDGINRERRLL